MPLAPAAECVPGGRWERCVSLESRPVSDVDAVGSVSVTGVLQTLHRCIVEEVAAPHWVQNIEGSGGTANYPTGGANRDGYWSAVALTA